MIKVQRKSKAQLKREIRKAIDEANWRMFEYENAVEESKEFGGNLEINPVFKQEFENLYKNGGLSGVERSAFGERLKPAFSTKFYGEYKDYWQLEEQLEQLQDFIEMDIYSPVAKEEYDAVTETKYQTFLSNSGLYEEEFTRADWEASWDAFKTLQDNAEMYGYEDRESKDTYRNLYTKLDRKQRRTFGDVLLDAASNVLLKNNQTLTAKNIVAEMEKILKVNK